MLPDSAIQVRALTKATKAVFLQHPDMAFRINLARAALQVDMTPDDEKVRKLHAQMLSELEAVAHRGDKERGSRDTAATPPAKVKGVEPQVTTPTTPKAPKPPKGNPKTTAPPKGGAAAEIGSGRAPCTFYVGVNGCKKGADCTYEHNWAAFSQAEKASRCKACGSKNHKAAECKAGTKVEEKAKAKAPRGPKGGGDDTGAAPSASTGGDPGQQHIKSMLADAARFLQQVAPPPPGSVTQDPPVAAVPIPGAPTPPNAKASPTTPVQGTPVTLASISAQLETLRAMASDPQVRALEPGVPCEDGVSMAVMCENRASLRALIEEAEVRLSRTQAGAPDAPVALLDSGATHAVIPYESSLTNLERVPVTLAGDAKQEWWKTAGGTLVVPPGSGTGAGASSTQVILPLGALVETLGCQVSWSKRRGLRVQHPTLGLLDTGVSSNTCPYVQERQALSLIAELESARLKDFSEQVQNLECQLEAFAQAPDPTTAIQGFIMGKTRKDALCALMAQPYFKDVSEDAKAAMAEAIPAFDDVAGKAALKDLPLKRAVRRTLQASSQWVVHLWAQERDMPVLRVDLLEKGGKGWDLTKPQSAWRALLWAAAAGKIAVILSSPPQNQEGPKQRLHLQILAVGRLNCKERRHSIPCRARRPTRQRTGSL